MRTNILPRIDAERRPALNAVSLYFYEYLQNGKTKIVKDITFEEVDSATIFEPTFTIPMESAQELMDRLWNCGIRPTEGAGSAGSLRATENHLKDMQKLVERLMTTIESFLA